MNDTPLPFVVRAIRQLGLPGVNGTRENAAFRSEWLCPSTTRTLQPKLSHFSGRGASSRTSETGAIPWTRVIVDDGDHTVETVVAGK